MTFLKYCMHNLLIVITVFFYCFLVNASINTKNAKVDSKKINIDLASISHLQTYPLRFSQNAKINLIQEDIGASVSSEVRYNLYLNIQYFSGAHNLIAAFKLPTSSLEVKSFTQNSENIYHLQTSEIIYDSENQAQSKQSYIFRIEIKDCISQFLQILNNTTSANEFVNCKIEIQSEKLPSEFKLGSPQQF